MAIIDGRPPTTLLALMSCRAHSPARGVRGHLHQIPARSPRASCHLIPPRHLFCFDLPCVLCPAWLSAPRMRLPKADPAKRTRIWRAHLEHRLLSPPKLAMRPVLRRPLCLRVASAWFRTCSFGNFASCFRFPSCAILCSLDGPFPFGCLDCSHVGTWMNDAKDDRRPLSS
jgi:hypothetical protein